MTPEQKAAITEKTPIKLTIVSALLLVSALIGTGFSAARFLAQFETKSDGLQQTMWELQGQLKRESENRWSVPDMLDYSRELRAANGPVMRSDNSSGLVVPDAREIHENNL